MLIREIKDLLVLYSQSFRSVLLVGPRQSGKTTLAKQTFPDKPYVSLENPDQRTLALNDPRAFLNRFPNGAILDEVQRSPMLLNYLQEILDNINEDGLFILTGSNNILLQESVTQTLAGRLGILDLLPLSYRELKKEKYDFSLGEIIINGFYPELYEKKRKAEIWYPSYIRTYVERDVRQVKSIENVMLFTKFIRLCAGRIGQQLNLTSLSNDCGIDVRTVQSWLSVLESTYVIKLLEPYYHNYNKRLAKSPKLYFIDSGLASALLNIKSADEFMLSHFRGALVENFFIMECVKNNLNRGLGQHFYYWRDNNGVEIDLIIESSEGMLPVEIKSGQTYTKDFSKNLKKFMAYSDIQKGLVIYDGEMEFVGSDGIKVSNWKNYLLKD